MTVGERVGVLLVYDQNFALRTADVDSLRARFPDVEFHQQRAGTVTLEQLEQADVIFGWPPTRLLATAERPRWLQIPSVGADRYVDDPQFPAGVTLTNARGVFGVPVAELAVALTFALARKLHTHVRQGTQRVWKRHEAVLEIAGSTVAILGMGDIGAQAGRRFQGLGARVIGFRRDVGAPAEFADEVHPTHALAAVLADADVLVCALPSTAGTVVDEAAIKALPGHALVVNVGRGNTIAEPALIEALRERRIAGAGLDVAWDEPLPDDSLLWELDNVILTSHSAGMTQGRFQRRLDLFAAQLERFLAGEPLVNVIKDGA